MFSTKVQKFLKFKVFKFLKYKDHKRCLYGNTYISVNMICHNEKSSTIFF